MPSALRPITATLALTSLSLAACGAQPEEPDEQAEEAAPLEVVATAGLDVVSGPVMAGDVALVYVTAAGDGLDLVGVDPSSGEELWRQAASPGEVVTGIAVSPRVVNGHPVYFRPSDVDNLYAQLVVAEPGTGEDVVVTEPKLFTSTPGPCEDDDTVVCLNVRDNYDATATQHRLATDGDGTLVADTSLETISGTTRPIGSAGLVDLRVEDTEYLAVHEDGSELWREPVAEVFGEGYSSDYGWSWEYDEPSDRYFGYVGAALEEGEDTIVMHMARARMVAIDRASGEVLWSEDGVRHLCDLELAVPTDEEVARLAEGETSVNLLPVPVRCRTEGTVTYDRSPDGADPQYDGFQTVLEGYDPETGETTWQTPFEGRELLAFDSASETQLIRSGRTAVVVEVEGEPTAVDLVTGEMSDPEGETLWCAGQPVSFDYAEPYYFDGEPSHARHGDPLYELCDASGAPLGDDPAPDVVPNGVGAVSGDLTVVATPDGLVTYR